MKFFTYISRPLSLLLMVLILSSVTASAQKKGKLTDELKRAFELSYMNGEKEKMLLNYDESIKHFKSCLAIDPTIAAVYFNLADLYFLKKMPADAEAYDLQAIKLDKENIWYHRLLADIYEQKRDYQKAGEVSLYIANKEKEIGTLIEAAYFFTMAKNYKKAIETLDKVEKITGINEDIVKQKEQIYLAENKLNKAIEEIQKLIVAYPEETRYKGMLADLYVVNGMPEKGFAIYKEIVEKEPGNGFALFALSDHYKAAGDNDKYYEYMKRGMASTDVDSKSKLRVLLSFVTDKDQDSDHTKGLELAQIFVKANQNDALPYLVLADLYVEEKRFAEAHEQYRKSVAIDPSSLVAWQQIVYCSGEMRDNAMLQKDCEDALEYFPNEPVFYVYHTIASMQLKEYEKAVASAKKGIEYADENIELRVQLYSSMGDAYHYLKNNAACDSAYEQALMLDSGNAYALNNYAYFLSLRKTKLDKAEYMSKKSLELDPGNASYMDTYGWILFEQKNYHKAKEYILKSLEAAPNNAEVVEHLGDVLYHLNEKQQAIEQWKKAKELGSETEFIDRKIRDGKFYE